MRALAIRIVSWVTVFACTSATAVPLGAQTAPDPQPPRSSSGEAEFFPVGEHLDYGIALGRMRLGEATMRVEEKVSLEGTVVYRTSLRIDIGAAVLDYEVGLESWIEPSPFRSRVFQRREPGETRQVENYRFHPGDRRADLEVRDVESGAVLSRRRLDGLPVDALDELAALFLLRTLSLAPDETLRLRRYFDPSAELVEFTRVRAEEIRVPAGRYETVVYRTVIGALAAFQAERNPLVYVSDDEDRLIVQIETDTPVGRLRMYLVDERVLGGSGT